eukprot:CAMPEP_0172589202 /NCGR_PEP_ID=MMETSP1068-20121228/7989_1 /TAXON_ID=35684 /ORGANISM="Pseudopedinella elastica, Strain CCMP716" /LENGTH=486 /DNA_ID=CAMNT_0013384749 /DNA_START=55 /DNA_END=1515 /DNA_ORIENTATION=+
MSAGMPPDDDKRVPPFVSKLYDLVQRFPTVCSFGPDGESIIMHNPKYLERDILPRYFRHGNYRSFVRQLNLYEFRKDHNRKQVVYRHKDFRRDRPDLLHLIERQPSQKEEAQEENRAEADIVIPETVPRHLHSTLSVFRPGANVDMWAENSWLPGEVEKWTPEGIKIRSVQENASRFVDWSAVDTELRLSSALGPHTSSSSASCPALTSMPSAAPPKQPAPQEPSAPCPPVGSACDLGHLGPCTAAASAFSGAASEASVLSHPRYLEMAAERNAMADLCRKANMRCVRLEDKCAVLEAQLKDKEKRARQAARPVMPPWGAGAEGGERLEEGAPPRSLPSLPRGVPPNPSLGNRSRGEGVPQLWHFEPSKYNDLGEFGESAPPIRLAARAKPQSLPPKASMPQAGVPPAGSSSCGGEYNDLFGVGGDCSLALDDSCFAALLASVGGEAHAEEARALDVASAKRPKHLDESEVKAKIEEHPLRGRFFY